MGHRLERLININARDYFQASNVMTGKKDILITEYSNIDVKSLITHMEKYHFDLSIIKKDRTEYGYILLEEIIEEKTFKDSHFHCYQSNEIIHHNKTVVDVIDKFYNTNYIFVEEDDIFSGLITYADLNRQPILAFLYIALSYYETRLRKIVQHFYPNDSWLQNLSDEILEEIGGRHLKDKVKNIERSLIENTTLMHLTNILRKKTEWKNWINLTSKRDYNAFYYEVNNTYRNPIMHSKNIIPNKGSVKTFCDFIKKFNDNLEKVEEFIEKNNI